MRRLFWIILFLSSTLQSQASTFIIDQHFSPNASAADFLFLQNELMGLQSRYQNYLSHKTHKNKTSSLDAENLPLEIPQLSLGQKILKRSQRLAEISFVWNPLGALTAITQHEVFGHGFRLRDLGRQNAQIKGYHLNRPPPYGKGGGYTKYSLLKPISLSQTMLIQIAGMEASTLLAHHTILSWLSKRKVDGREANLLIASHFDLPIYALSIRNFDDIILGYQKETGHDVINYLMCLHFLYPSDSSLRTLYDEIQESARFTILSNLFVYYALAAQIQYIWNGIALDLAEFKYSPIRFYIPTYQLELTPFGPQDCIGNYLLLRSGEPYYFYYKHGSFSKNTYTTLGFENQGIFSYKQHSFGLKLDLWNQPRFLDWTPENQEAPSYYYYESRWGLGMIVRFDQGKNSYTEEELFSKTKGGSFAVIYKYAFDPTSRNSLYTLLGYKTKGYLPGESISRGLLFRCGLSLLF